ncbi:hypothetical protein [Cryobacterium psychrophilum]|uniref:Uncharacterized protein n=1 Tax=Cryobacterium psychrophilum TaxID=41988 RepID=A0A4Y8KUG2_9MICO|nr:hypothetical protein [Cryobacterium psychrophilum]TDW30133.1 hypothetical protein EDD25_1874 [Cryobacterium psychrophilum]TFD80599.1 hypothetical protein E3T53_04620 [Cryobacterium psychrophilum]
MPRQNFLDRFRPVGAPGGAGPAGVPASDELGPEAELAPVFAALAADVAECSALVEEATNEADRMLARARERADAVVAQARLDTGAEESRAAARVLQVAAEADAGLLAAADAEAAALKVAGVARLPVAVRRVLDAMLGEQLAPR